MELAAAAGEDLVRRAGGDPNAAPRPPAYKAVGLTLAIASGLFIGTSFVLKKVGLLKANVKYNEEAGEGYGYLKNAYWWTGMTLMIVGEICNFVAYALYGHSMSSCASELTFGPLVSMRFWSHRWARSR